MSQCEFSEFSFGYALTDSLVSALKGSLGAAPMFANQVAEGKAGGGYDMKLPINPVPIFFQFKIPGVLTRASSRMPKGYGTPYYRMALRTKSPNQHALLLDLEKVEPLVFYAAPLFDKVTDLDLGFFGKGVHKKCIFVRPSSIGSLDQQSHCLAYRVGASSYWVQSDPREIGVEFGYEAMAATMRREIERASPHSQVDRSVLDVSDDRWTTRNRQVLFAIRDWMIGAYRHSAEMNVGRRELIQALREEPDSPTEFARRLSYVSQVHFGLMMGLVEAA